MGNETALLSCHVGSLDPGHKKKKTILNNGFGRGIISMENIRFITPI
jgi:hypothetical protein